jgi:hypothetical protein
MLTASELLENDELVVAASAQEDVYVRLTMAAGTMQQWLQGTMDRQRDELRPLLTELIERMLVQQRFATVRTASLDESRQRGQWSEQARRDLLAVHRSEMDIAGMVERASEFVARDGSTVAFAGLLAELRGLLSRVLSLLGDEDTGPRTRGSQQDAEKVMASLLRATEENKQTVVPKTKFNWIKPPREPKAPPLIPVATELRLLLDQQVLINERTAAIQDAARTERLPEHDAELQRLAELQRRIRELIRGIMKTLQEGSGSDLSPL